MGESGAAREVAWHNAQDISSKCLLAHVYKTSEEAKNVKVFFL